MTTNENLALARQLFKDGDIDRALDCVAQVPTDYLWTASDLIMKARLIQLGSDDGRFTLDDAASCLRDAIAAEPSNPFPLMELAFFEGRVLARSEPAEVKFVKVLEMLSKYIGECLGGLLEARDLDPSNAQFEHALTTLLRQVEESAIGIAKKTAGSMES